MTRYHFHAADGATLRDSEGEELPDIDAAKAVAPDVMAALLPMKRHEFWRRKMLSVSVTDETGRLVAVITATAPWTLSPKLMWRPKTEIRPGRGPAPGTDGAAFRNTRRTTAPAGPG
ncbi:hypothetical protein GCM10009116_15830 [Brevundimonas basaltis]|uniref:DUF6894 family protein n=1 Tax=Brevundimonas basaltis TaxID=472166 RepID=UPI003371952E